MIRNLKLKAYRSFESYELRDLARVNLLVGKNNCGKTSILEAVHFLVSGGDPHVLRTIAQQRGEERGGRDRYRVTDISHFMFGHRFVPGFSFSISSDNRPKFVRVSVGEYTGDLDYYQRPMFDGDVEDKDVNDADLLAVHITSSGIKDPLVIPATVDGSLHLDPRAMRIVGFDGMSAMPVGFVTAASLSVDVMRGMWDSLVRERREAEVVDALKLVEHNIDSVHFLGANGYRGGDIVLGLQDSGQRNPIGSHGDGIRRLLALALSLTQLSGGVLLVDEIDTGLHWTILEGLWKLVIEQAARTNIQVFATTHSHDCIRGLASLTTSHPHLASEFTVQKVERELAHAVAFDSGDVERAIDHEIELR